MILFIIYIYIIRSITKAIDFRNLKFIKFIKFIIIAKINQKYFTLKKRSSNIIYNNYL